MGSAIGTVALRQFRSRPELLFLWEVPLVDAGGEHRHGWGLFARLYRQMMFGRWCLRIEKIARTEIWKRLKRCCTQQLSTTCLGPATALFTQARGLEL